LKCPIRAGRGSENGAAITDDHKAIAGKADGIQIRNYRRVGYQPINAVGRKQNGSKFANRDKEIARDSGAMERVTLWQGRSPIPVVERIGRTRVESGEQEYRHGETARHWLEGACFSSKFAWPMQRNLSQPSATGRS
jgi:hypothetical protein